TIAAGAFATLTFNLTARTSPGTMISNFTVDPNNTIPESNEANNSVSDSIDAVNAGPNSLIDLTIVKTASTPTPAPGATFTYSLLVTTPGSATGFNVQVRDELPAGVTFVSASSTGGAAGFACGQTSPGIIDCVVGSLAAAGGNQTITLTVTAPNGPNG